MEFFKELVSVVRPGKVRYPDLIGQKNDQVESFYELIQTKKFETEDEIKDFFFGDKPFKDKYYEGLKRRLKDRLVYSLLAIQPDEKSSELLKVNTDCHKKYAAAMILTSQGKRQSGMKLAEETIKKAMKYHLSKLVLPLAEELQYYYGGIAGDQKKYNYYSEVILKYKDLKEAELKAQTYYCDTLIHFAKSKSRKPELTPSLKTYCEELMKDLALYNSYYYALLTYTLTNIYYQLINDHQKIIQTGMKAIRYFEQLPYSVPRASLYFLHKILPSYIQLKRFEEAQECIETCLALASHQSINHLITLQHKLVLGFHSGHYTDLPQIIEESKPLVTKYPFLKEQWKIYAAYVHFFTSIGKTGAVESKFRLGKFLNDLPTYSKDKRGMNINILILQILFLLERKKYNQIIDRTDALKSYSTRYLRQNETYRSNCFIKLLLLLPACHFHPKAVERKAKTLLDNLYKVPISESLQDDDLEIVPYETLWQIVLERL